MPEADDKITIGNVNHPDHSERVDRAKYMAMHDALMAVLPTARPDRSPGQGSAAAAPLPGSLPRRRKGRLVAQGRSPGSGIKEDHRPRQGQPGASV